MRPVSSSGVLKLDGRKASLSSPSDKCCQISCACGSREIWRVRANRISGLDRGSDAISRDIDAGTEIGVCVAIEPEAREDGIDVPACRADVGPVAANAITVDSFMAHILLLSDGKTAHVAGGLGISEEQSDPVHRQSLAISKLTRSRPTSRRRGCCHQIPLWLFPPIAYPPAGPRIVLERQGVGSGAAVEQVVGARIALVRLRGLANVVAGPEIDRSGNGSRIAPGESIYSRPGDNAVPD